MLKLILFIFVLSVSTTRSQNNEIQPAVVATCDVFNRSGLTCRDCSTLTRCVLMNNVWESYDVDTCNSTEGYYCNSIEERCSKSAGSCNRLVEFKCFEESYFPNPFSCQEYYICLRIDGSEVLGLQRFCESGTAYNPRTQTCTLALYDPLCLQLQWTCNFPGDLGLWPGTDDIFYLCQRNPENNFLYPQLHKCLNDQIFDGTNCVFRPQTTTTTTTEATTVTAEVPEV